MLWDCLVIQSEVVFRFLVNPNKSNSMTEQKKTKVLLSNEELLKRQLKQAHDLIDRRLKEMGLKPRTK